jgi:hypothetical protein
MNWEKLHPTAAVAICVNSAVPFCVALSIFMFNRPMFNSIDLWHLIAICVPISVALILSCALISVAVLEDSDTFFISSEEVEQNPTEEENKQDEITRWSIAGAISCILLIACVVAQYDEPIGLKKFYINLVYVSIVLFILAAIRFLYLLYHYMKSEKSSASIKNTASSESTLEAQDNASSSPSNLPAKLRKEETLNSDAISEGYFILNQVLTQVRDTTDEQPLPDHQIYWHAKILFQASNRTRKIIMEKLESDGYVKTVLIDKQTLYYITFEGIFFLETGGYVSEIASAIERNTREERLERSQTQNRNVSNRKETLKNRLRLSANSIFVLSIVLTG